MTYPEHRSISARELAEKLRDSKDLRFIDLQDSQLCPHLAALAEVDLRFSNLSKANLQGANLRGANLRGARLAGTKLQGADLRGANLTECPGITATQFANADMEGASVPPNWGKEAYEAAKSSAKKCQFVFYALLIAAAYCVLVHASTTPAGMVLGEYLADIPILALRAKYRNFYAVAPFILVCVQGYLHLLVTQFLNQVDSLPRVLPNGRRVQDIFAAWPAVAFHGDPIPGGAPINPQPVLERFRQWLVYTIHPGLFVAIGIALQTTLQIAMLHKLVMLWRILPRPSLDHFSEAWPALSLSVLLPNLDLEALIAMLLCSFSTCTSALLTTHHWHRWRLPHPHSGETKRLRHWLPHGSVLAACCLALGYFPGDSAALVVHNDRPHMLDLQGMNFEAADLRRADLSGSELNRTNLRNARLMGADLRWTRLQHADLSGANLSGAWLRGARLRGARFHSPFAHAEPKDSAQMCVRADDTMRTHMVRARFCHRMARSERLEKLTPPCPLDLTCGVDLFGLNLSDVDLRYADFRCVALEPDPYAAELKACAPEHRAANTASTGPNSIAASSPQQPQDSPMPPDPTAAIRCACFGWAADSPAQQCCTAAQRAHAEHTLYFMGSQLRRADFTGARFSSDRFPLSKGEACNNGPLQRVAFCGADLSYSELYGADFRHVHFGGATLEGANLAAADLRHAQLLGANLRAAQLLGTRLAHANLTGADLTGADLTGADLSAANLTGANLTSVTLNTVKCDTDTIWPKQVPAGPLPSCGPHSN